MPEYKISVFIVNYNASDFILSALYALKKLTKNPYKVVIIDNGSRISDYLNLKNSVSAYKHIELRRIETNEKGSLAHSLALNILTKDIDTPYFTILDADAAWLKKDWDDILIKKLSSTVKAIGTQAPELKPQDFPIMFAMFFETKTFESLNIDFRPAKIGKMQDTGWEMREKYQGSGYSALNITRHSTRSHKNGPFGNIAGVDEFYFENYTDIFACHFGRGSNPFGKRIINFKSGFLRIIFLPINLLLWHRDKRSWINTCRRIINNQ